MFKSIRFIRSQDNQYVYLLEDTDFTCEILHRAGYFVAALISEYKKRNLPVAKNIAMFYVSRNKDQEISEWIINNLCVMDREYPELEYGKKYFRCVKNQVNKMLRSKYV